MDYLVIIPMDVIMILLDTLDKLCRTSFIMLSYVNNFWHLQTTCYAIKNNMKSRGIDYRDTIRNGYLTIFQWYVQKHDEQYGNSLSIIHETKFFRRDTSICNNAAENGHYHIVRWAHANGFEVSSEVCVYASRNGNLEFLIEFWQKGIFWNPYICYKAAEHGHLNILKWIKSIGNLVISDTNICKAAAKGGQLEILKWLRENNCQWDIDMCKEAAKYGQLELLQWARQNDCEWRYDNVYIQAAKSGQLEILQWLRQNGGVMTSEVYYHAILLNNLEMIEWAYQIGIPVITLICQMAFMRNQPKILQWAISHGCPCNPNILNYARERWPGLFM